MSRSEIIRILKTFKKESAEEYGILTLGIFGSVARDEAECTSDVDIVVTTKTPDPYIIVHIKESIEKKLQLPVDIIRHRNKMNPFLKKRIDKEVVYV
ncbi:nucleotidyltransferase domain-containing protein [bacterium]|nr:nucleotidyltransferase domain-containing protein [bacterium]